MDNEDENEEDLRETGRVLISPKDLRDLLDRAYECGRCAAQGFPAYLPPLGRWDRTRDGWITSKLECNAVSPRAHIPCEILGIHEHHSARGGSPPQWFSWDENGMTPGQPDLPAGYERWYYEENKEWIDKLLAEDK